MRRSIAAALTVAAVLFPARPAQAGPILRAKAYHHHYPMPLVSPYAPVMPVVNAGLVVAGVHQVLAHLGVGQQGGGQPGQRTDGRPQQAVLPPVPQDVIAAMDR